MRIVGGSEEADVDVEDSEHERSKHSVEESSYLSECSLEKESIPEDE